jgi:hypothetical protein
VIANTRNGGVIGADAVDRSGVWGVGPLGLTLRHVQATGGSITFVDDWVVHTFNASGTFTPLVSSLTVEYLVVAWWRWCVSVQAVAAVVAVGTAPVLSVRRRGRMQRLSLY